ncbi:MAG: phosphatidylglycerol lysyltransferase [Treponema sp.]|nr:phosphatidylglycerol lysyltransferase [Treponema sp.]
MNLELNGALSRMILSASGWRGVFAGDGDEESAETGIPDAHRIIAAAAAKVFSDYVAALPGQAAKGAIIVGRDTRPTGQVIASAVIRALLAEGRQVRYVGVAAAPEIMAFARSAGACASDAPAGFIYISASHNPIGHNGIKFGRAGGGVLAAKEAGALASAFRAFLACPDSVRRLGFLLEESSPERAAAVYAAASGWKEAALTAYREFTEEVVSGSGEAPRQKEFFAALRKGIEKRPVGIAVDFNGSARTLSIDRDFFSSLGAGFFAINDTPGEIAHRIVPEGEALDPCRAFMRELRGKGLEVGLGYVPDCDGDRGNLVIWDERERAARVLQAQEGFALACVAELSFLVWTGELTFDGSGNALTSVAVAVNDPTSLRIDRIARAFGARVFRAEVGEANVTGLAEKLREQGYVVRILGEGSAGGTIIHPSSVRDPVCTVVSALKLLAIREKGHTGKGLFRIWLERSGQGETYREDFTLADVIASLPAFATTGAYAEEALVKIKTADHSRLKENYQKVFAREWEAKKDMLKNEYGIAGWEAIAYNGMEERRGIRRFSEAGTGGLKIEFLGDAPDGATACGETVIASIWMRGSATEPVFRIMADAPDTGRTRRLERTLIEWQRRMALEADVQ